jgi:hypothetical protein
MTRFVETHPYGLVCALISAMLTIGAIASLVVALG